MAALRRTSRHASERWSLSQLSNLFLILETGGFQKIEEEGEAPITAPRYLNVPFSIEQQSILAHSLRIEWSFENPYRLLF